MSIRKFIGTSSALLLAWLGATYFHKVPAERYPSQQSPTANATGNVVVPADKMIATHSSEKADFR